MSGRGSKPIAGAHTQPQAQSAPQVQAPNKTSGTASTQKARKAKAKVDEAGTSRHPHRIASHRIAASQRIACIRR